MSRRIGHSAVDFSTRAIARCLCLAALFAATLAPAARANNGPAFLIKDINPTFGQPQHNIRSDLVVLGTRIYFIATDGRDVYGLWKSDGTVAGTALVKELPSYPFAQLKNIGGTLYSVVGDSYGVRELWKSDGTTAGTIQLKSFAPRSTVYSRVLRRDLLYTQAHSECTRMPGLPT
jgi:ELWxxDGT repeat protein